MALQIVCVERAGKGDHRHVVTVGVATGNTIIRFSVKTVRRLIKNGDVSFYAIGPDGRKERIRRFRCTCGRGSLRTGSDDVNDGVLSDLPSCRD